MSFTQILEELPSLTSDERQLLIERASELEGGVLSPEEEAIIDERLAAHDRDPSTAVSFDAIMERLQTKYGR